MENNNSLKVLISSFACGPNWGSEVGMGWNWIIHLSRHCQLYVITEKGFENEIENEIVKLNLNYIPVFYYIDIGDEGRKLFWKQGSLLFYYHYNKWQKKTYLLSQHLIMKHQIRLIHQLNLIGFREPGYLWKLPNQTPFIWGPVGGFNQVPLNYIFRFSIKNKLFYFGKHLIHFFQVHFQQRVKKAMNTASIIFAESDTTKKIIKKVYKTNSILMNETGADFKDFYEHPSFCENDVLHLLWVGKIQGLKGLPIALQTIKRLKGNVPVKMTIVGDGPDEQACRKLAKKLDLNKTVSFLGKIPNKDVKELMKVHDLLFFTSLKEGTPHVVLEALSNGLPVLCHDACGHGDIINDTCGIKIALKSYNRSIKYFTQKLEYLYNNKNKFYEFSSGARNCVETYSWENKSKEMFKIYKKLMKTDKKNQLSYLR